MNAQDLHVRFENVVQGLSNRPLGKLVPQEVDFFLNRAVEQYITNLQEGEKTNTGKAYQQNQKRVDDIRQALKTGFPVKAYRITSEDDVMYCLLPSDYQHYEQSRSILYTKCKTAITKTYEDISKYYVVLPLRFDDYTWYNGYTLTWVDTEGPVSHQLLDQDLLDYFVENSQVFEMQEIMLQAINSKTDETGITAYWERYHNIYKPDSLILEVLSSTGELQESGAGGANDQNYDPEVLTLSSPVVTNYSTLQRKSLNTHVASHMFETINNFSFGKTAWNQPLIRIVENRIEIKEDDKFIVDSILLDYIKEIPKINLIHNVGLPFATYICNEIVNIAANQYYTIKGSARQPAVKDELTKS